MEGGRVAGRARDARFRNRREPVGMTFLRAMGRCRAPRVTGGMVGRSHQQ